MIETLVPFLFIISLAGLFYYYLILKPAQKRVRRERLRSQPFPPDWEEILTYKVPLFRHLPVELRHELQGHIQVFLAEKYFEGCDGLVITDAMRVCIAAQACLLLLQRDTDYYPRLDAILVYPQTFVVRQKVTEDGLIPLDDRSERLGESWKQGMVVLAWDQVKQGASDYRDGQNLVLHEFAHQLDEEDGAANGTPALKSRSQYAAWNAILTREFERLRRASDRRQRDVLDPYGASNPAEFFAVTVEAFYEKPHQLKAKHPDLYEQLRHYFNVNPVEWFSKSV